jgi:hypothetical protein
MGFISKKVGDFFAFDLIKKNTGKSVQIIDKGVCDVTEGNRRGVFVKTNEGYFWVAKVDRENPNGWCIEIESTSVTAAFEHPSRCFNVNGRPWFGHQMSERNVRITLVAMTPNVLEILQNLEKN